jgi:excisionase family DNA binding protein
MRHLIVDRDDTAPAVPTERTRSTMTAEEVGAFLRLSASTVRRLAARGELPSRRIAGAWRFDRDAIESLIPQR